MSRRTAAPASAASLRIDPIECEGVGICAHLAPETVTVDPWGYPIIDDSALEGRRLRRAKAAAAACPRRALYLVDHP